MSAEKMESTDELLRQTERLAQKAASLEILCDVVDGINQCRDLDEMLSRLLHVLREMVGADSATVRLVTDDGRLQLVASLGLTDQEVRSGQLVSMDSCMPAVSAERAAPVCQRDPRGSPELSSRMSSAGRSLELITLPLCYQEEALGILNLFVTDSTTAHGSDLQQLLTRIGHQLGIAIHNARREEEARRLTVLMERTTMAHELHDSLAQTLASLRFQVQTLQEMATGYLPVAAERHLAQVGDGVEQANSELREMLTQFRAPMDPRGVREAITGLVQRFRRECPTRCYLQDDEVDIKLSATLEMQVVRIVQEALANVRKHSKARNVLVILRDDGDQNVRILIEDDGVGFDPAAVSDGNSRHLGLSIMRERAKRLLGEINIESELGEGTRIELTFRSGAD